MRVQIQLRIVSDDDTVLSEDVIACFDKGDDQLEEIGLSLDQAKTVLAGAQVSLVAAQAASFLTRHRETASSVVGTARANGAAVFCSAPRSAPFPWSGPWCKNGRGVCRGGGRKSIEVAH
jgi:hypothetical protein